MNRQMLIPAAIIAVSAIFVTIPQAIFIVNETDQVVITRLGEYRRTITQPGIYMKMPILEQVVRFDKRVLTSDANPGQYLTLDKKRLAADHVSRWRIVDPLVFYKTVRDIPGARSRLDDIVFSEMRRELAAHDFGDIISEQRETIMDSVADSTREKIKQFGIDVVDVRIKRADLPVEVQASVFARMQAERGRIAKRYRSEGEEEAAKLRAETDKQRTIILAKAYEESQKIRGEADATSTQIYGDAFGRDPEFYRFLRSLEVYEAVLRDKASIVLASNSRLLRYLDGPSGDRKGA